MADDLRETTRQMQELLKYTQQLEAAIGKANDAQTRNNLQVVLQERLGQYGKLVEKVKELEKVEAKAAGERVGKAFQSALAGVGGLALGGAAPAIGRVLAGGAAGGRLGHDVAGKPGAVFGAAAGATGSAVAASADAVTSAFKTLVNASNLLGAAMAPFAQSVRLFDPGAAMRFGLALEDLSASVGRIVEPFITAATKFADVLNSTITSLAPVLLPVFETIATYTREYAETIVAALLPAVRRLAPVFQSVVEAMRTMTPVVGETVAKFAELAADVLPLLLAVVPPLMGALQLLHTVIQETIAGIRATLTTLRYVVESWGQRGAWAPERIQQVFMDALEQARRPALQELQSGPRTTAARQAHVVGIEDIGRNARLAAFTGARDPGERTAAATERAANGIERSNSWLQDIARAASERDAAGEAQRNNEVAD